MWPVFGSKKLQAGHKLKINMQNWTSKGMPCYHLKLASNTAYCTYVNINAHVVPHYGVILYHLCVGRARPGNTSYRICYVFCLHCIAIIFYNLRVLYIILCDMVIYCTIYGEF